MTKTEGDLNEERAVRYFDAARLLNRGQDAFWEPFNLLLGMGAELTLKAFLMRAGVPDKKLRHKDVRHSLNELCRLAVTNGLSASANAVRPILLLHEAHASHSFRYTSNLAPGRITAVFYPVPEDAIAGLGKLLDQASPNPQRLRHHVTSGIDWPIAAAATHPLKIEQLEYWIKEITSRQALERNSGPNIE